MIEALKKKLARLEARRAKLDSDCKAATDAAAVRSMTETLGETNEEIEETRSMISYFEEQYANDARYANCEKCDGLVASRAFIGEPLPDNVRYNAGIVASYSQAIAPKPEYREEDDPTASIEYRKAFMRYFQRGIPIPADLQQRVANYMAIFHSEMRAGDAISTENAGAVIPITVMREVINTIRKRYGLYRRVTKLSVPGAVEFPIGALQASFHWTTESTVSPRQGIGSVATVSFKYHQLELRIAQTFLSSILSIDAFEAKVPEVIATAYLKAWDIAIVKGSGVGQPLGIINDTRVTGQAGHTIAITAAEINNWTAWRKKFFAKLPLGYRDGEFIFNLSTVDSYLETMADGNNNPIFRQATGLEVNDGDAAEPNGRFFGRYISLVEPEILPDFDTASSNDVIGIYWQPEEYAINENFGFMMRRYFDDDINMWINKAITVADGKTLNPNGFYLITKA